MDLLQNKIYISEEAFLRRSLEKHLTVKFNLDT